MVSVSSRPSKRVRVHALEEEMCLSRVNFERLTGLVFALHREWQREYGKRKAVDKREKEAREQHTKTAKKWTSELTKCAKIQKKYSHLKKEAITSEKRYINKLISEKKSTDEAKLKGYSNFTERQKLQQELDESKETTELMRGRTISLEQELRDLGEKFDSQEIYKNGLQGELEQVTQTKIDLKDVLKRERQEITSIRKENTTLFRTLTQTNGTLSALQGTKQRNEELERKYAKLQKEFERMSMNNKNMSSKLESVSRENQQFSDRLIFVEANAVNSKVQLDKLMQLSSATESELRRQLADQSKTGREAQEEAEGLRARLRELEGVDGKFAEHKTQATEVEKRLQKEIEQNRQLNLLERERNDLAVQSMDAQVQATQRIIAEEKRAHKEKMRRQALQQYDDVRVKLERTHQRVAEREEESQKEKDALEQKIAQHMEQAELFKKKCESQIAATSKMYVKCQLCGKKNEFEVPCGLTDDDCFELECGRCKNITSQYGGNRNSDSENDEEPANAVDLDQASTQGDDNIVEMISSDTADGSSQGKSEPSGPSIGDNCSSAVSSSSKPKPEASTSSSSSMQDAEKFTPSASPLFVKVEGVTLYGREYIRKCMSNLDPFPDDEFNRLYREFLGDRKRHVERQTRRGVYSGRDVMGACRLTKTQFPELRKIIDKLLSDPASSRPALLVYLRAVHMFMSKVDGGPRPWIKPTRFIEQEVIEEIRIDDSDDEEPRETLDLTSDGDVPMIIDVRPSKTFVKKEPGI
eukprot:941384_1